MTHHLLATILNPPCKISKKFRWGSKERMSMSFYCSKSGQWIFFQEYYFLQKNT